MVEFNRGDVVVVRGSYDSVYFTIGDKYVVIKQHSDGVDLFNHMRDRCYIVRPEHLDLVDTLETKHHNTPSDEVSVSSGGSLRYNSGKPQFSHLSPDFILEMMKVMTKSAEKYHYLNYTKKQDVRTASDSLMRHFLSFQNGADNDEATQSAHLAHIATNAMIMFQNLKDFGDEVDNRFSKEKDKVQK